MVISLRVDYNQPSSARDLRGQKQEKGPLGVQVVGDHGYNWGNWLGPLLNKVLTYLPDVG